MTTTEQDPPALPFLDGRPKELLIDGAWRAAASGATLPTYNPSTGALLAELAAGDTADVDLAVMAARRAFEGPWSRWTPAQRQNALLRLADLVDEHREELKLLDVLDMGRPAGRSKPSGEGEWLRYFAGWATKIHGDTISPSTPTEFFTYTRKEPVGVVASIIPWNGPLRMSLWKIAPVLATGCTMVLKPAEEASLSPLRLGELVLEAGIPEGVVNIVTGLGEAAGAALAAHPDVDKIAFTGSEVTGQRIVHAATGNLKRVTLELGGKSANIVLADADLDVVGPAAAMAAFSNTGQVCAAGTRLFVERSVHDEVVGRVSSAAESLTIGNSLDPKTQLGPLVSQEQLERVIGYLNAGKEQGAVAATGGYRVTDGDLAAGYFVAPTVFAEVSDAMRIAREEIFGPVVSVLAFDDVEEVIRRANATTYGLAAGVWTNDLSKAHRIAHGVRSGTVWVNSYLRFDPAVPFGGYKMSGWGRELGEHSIEEYLQTKSVWIDLHAA